MYLFWEDINFGLSCIRVRKKPQYGFYPKRCEEREIPVNNRLIEILKSLPRRSNSPFVLPSPRGNRDLHMLGKVKAVAKRTGLDPSRFTLKKFRSTFATRMLRAGIDVRTVQYWMGHKSLKTTMRYLSPAQDIRDRLDQATGILDELQCSEQGLGSLAQLQSLRSLYNSGNREGRSSVYKGDQAARDLESCGGNTRAGSISAPGILESMSYENLTCSGNRRNLQMVTKIVTVGNSL
jgi:hypothetical protein